MSDGTRDQLFFALRLAYIEKHCEEFGACPVILDDVLMAFDDARATAALRVLAELSKKTQILIFTHHAHHVELAKIALGKRGFILHDLEAGDGIAA
jgi:exonuclease SbcC